MEVTQTTTKLAKNRGRNFGHLRKNPRVFNEPGFGRRGDRPRRVESSNWGSLLSRFAVHERTALSVTVRWVDRSHPTFTYDSALIAVCRPGESQRCVNSDSPG